MKQIWPNVGLLAIVSVLSAGAYFLDGWEAMALIWAALALAVMGAALNKENVAVRDEAVCPGEEHTT